MRCCVGTHLFCEVCLYDLWIDDFGGSNSFWNLYLLQGKGKCKDEEGDAHKERKKSEGKTS